MEAIPQSLPTFPFLPQSFPSKQYNEKVVEASSALCFWDYHTTIQIVAKPTEALDTALVCLSLANPVLKLEVGRNPGSSQLKLSAS